VGSSSCGHQKAAATGFGSRCRNSNCASKILILHSSLQAEREKNQSPLVQFYTGLKQRADAKRQQLQASDVRVSAPGPSRDRGADEDSEDETGEAVFGGKWLPSGPKKEVAEK
jgi:hypothetical protein